MLQQNAVLTFTAFCGKIAIRNQIRQRTLILKRKNLFLFFNISFPLSIGLAIYVFCYQNTYINTTIENILGFSLPYFYFDNAFHRFLTCWVCDILWAYSLTFALFFCFKSFNKSWLITCILSISFSIVIELLQLVDIINGTFDIWDIVMEFSAIIIAVIILKKEFSKWKKSYQFF